MLKFSKEQLQDRTFARIVLAPNPESAIDKIQDDEWLLLTGSFVGVAWIMCAHDYRNGVSQPPKTYSTKTEDLAEIEAIQEHLRKYDKYRQLIVGAGKPSFCSYLHGITLEEFCDLMRPLRGMDAARKIQHLYREGIIDHGLGGTQLYTYMEELGLPHVPTINHLNEARRGETPASRYDMSKSRHREQLLEKRMNSRVINLKISRK